MIGFCCKTEKFAKYAQIWFQSVQVWHVKRCNIVCGNICVVYRNIYGLKHIFVD